MEKTDNLFSKIHFFYEGLFEIIDNPFPNENVRFIHQIEVQLSQGIHCGGGILL